MKIDSSILFGFFFMGLELQQYVVFGNRLATVTDDTLLTSLPLIMSHDAASGEIIEERDHVVMDWTKTQSVGLVGQLDCGARAFDYRPYLDKHDVLYAHHGPVVIHTTMESR